MEPTKIMVIGSDCSVSTSPIAELVPFWNLVQVGTDMFHQQVAPPTKRLSSSDVLFLKTEALTTLM